MRKYNLNYTYFLICSCFLTTVNCLQEVYQYSAPDNCTKLQYFDVESFKCNMCSFGFQKSNSGSSCSCTGLNKYSKYINDTIKEVCLQCKASEYVSKDRDSCVPRNCSNIGNGKITCSVCKKNQIVVTNSQNGTVLPVVECVTCSPGFLPSADKAYCRPCSLRVANSNHKLCECDKKKFNHIDDYCIPNAFVKNISMYKPTTKSGEVLQSNFFNKNLIPLLFLCSLKNSTACQMVANLCVFSLYSNIENSPCTILKNYKQVPVIMYGEEESYSVLYRKKIEIAYSLSKNSEYKRLNIIALTTDFNGFTKGFTNSNVPWMILCPTTGKSNAINFLQFAVNYKHKCTIKAKHLISNSETLIFEPYLKFNDDSKDSAPTLHAIPVLIKGNMVHFNKENDINTWQLVRRFYLLDKISGITKINGVDTLKYFRYVKYMEIRIRIRRKGKGERSKIYPPLFILHYAEIDDDEINQNIDLNLEISVNYELDGSNMSNGMEIAVGSISAFSILYTILQTWSYSKRSGKLGFDPRTFAQFFIFACGNLANSFFVVSFGASSYSFLIYKMQKVVYVLPPSNRDEYVIETYIIVAFSLKIIEVLAMNWKQINVDISFIDWEKPIQPLLEIGIKTPSKKNLKAETPVSFWRPYFVANEWNEIQTLRKISLPFHLVGCIFVIEVLGTNSLTHIGTEIDPNRSEEFMSSPAYQLALSGLTFLLLYFIQLVLSIFLYERFIKNAILDFMDVCSIANVSILILDTPLHGYYLHGRCIHASCETDARGLQPGLPYRAFSVRCTPDFRLYFSRLSTHMVINDMKWQWQHHISTNENENLNMGSSTTTGLNSARKSSGRSSRKDDDEVNITTLPSAIEHREQAAKLTNKFLTAFLDHALEDLDYEVREKRFFERLLDVELIDEGNYKTLFLYNTSGDSQSFQRSIWYGQEWTLATFDLYLFCLVQITTGNFVTAALVTAVVWKFLVICRQYGGKKNLAKKTLVDERFLI